MKNSVRKALTRTITETRRGRERRVQIPPSERLVYAVYFSLGMVVCLTALEIVHLVVLGRWNSEVFAAITGLIGTITGIFLTQRT